MRSYVISTSIRPPSNVKDSLGTPRGLHEIAERIGAGQPAGHGFQGARARPAGTFWNSHRDRSKRRISSPRRILWLRGLEPGVNLGGDVDTYDRYIYIHGTNHEARIGEPLSAGCVLLRNLDMIELYDEVRVRDQVLIVD